MIVTRTPLRISFFGGGTDYPQWYRQHGGAVLSTTIKRYCYTSCRRVPPTLADHHRVVWSQIEAARVLGPLDHSGVRECLNHLNIADGVAIVQDLEVPPASGLGSSSACLVSLLQGLYALQQRPATTMQLARDAIFIERDRLQKAVGVQDQVAVAFGGLNRIDIRPDDTMHVAPVALDADRSRRFQRHLLLVYTGRTRRADLVARAQIEAISSRRQELTAIREAVDEGLRLLSGAGPLEEIGRLLHDAWTLKRRLTDSITTPSIDGMYEAARRAGAVGGKLLGAGGGGFLLLLAEPPAHGPIRRALTGLTCLPIEFDQMGSRIIRAHDDQPTPASSNRDRM